MGGAILRRQGPARVIDGLTKTQVDVSGAFSVIPDHEGPANWRKMKAKNDTAGDLAKVSAALKGPHWWLAMLNLGGAWWGLLPWPLHLVLRKLFPERAKGTPRPNWDESSFTMTLAVFAASYVGFAPEHSCAFRAASDAARDGLLGGLAIATTLLGLGIAIPGSALFQKLRGDPLAIADYANVFLWPFIWAVPALLLLSVEDDESNVYQALEPGAVVAATWFTFFAIGQIMNAIGYALKMFIGGSLMQDRRPPV